MTIINGTSANDTKYGTTGIDTINGLGGADKLYGRAGNDTIDGGAGSDSLWGEDGNDILKGGSDASADYLYGGNGNDTILGGAGNDSLYGDAGTDTVKGEAGNDILKGGSGISYLYGGDGNDQLFYDPTTDNISKIGQYLKGSILDGGAGLDVLNVFNKATYTENGVSHASQTVINLDENGCGIRFTPHNGAYDSSIGAGTVSGVEQIVVGGNGGLYFSGDMYGSGIKITGTAVNDEFHSYYASDTMIGGDGNDTFVFGGSDTVVSQTNDADIFEFMPGPCGEGDTSITGFNGQGINGGDILKLDAEAHYTPKITEANGKTTFQVEEYASVTVDKVGLIHDVDYFFV